jgi:uncharacterized protein YkwD
MSRLRVLVSCLMVAWPAAMPAPASGSAATRMHDAVNRARVARGLPALRHAPVLSRSAGVYAHSLLSRHAFSHSGGFIGGRTFRFRSEVLALQTGGTLSVGKVLSAWLRSPGHRAVLLNRRCRFLGIGLASGRYGPRRVYVWVGRVGA